MTPHLHSLATRFPPSAHAVVSLGVNSSGIVIARCTVLDKRGRNRTHEVRAKVEEGVDAEKLLEKVCGVAGKELGEEK
jgi:hypothetical protein